MPGRLSVPVILSLILAGLCCGPAGCGSRLQMHPYCTAQHCPQCPQPLKMEVASPQCRECLSQKLQQINTCSQSQPMAFLDTAFIGVWRSSGGLKMRVVQTGQDFKGTLVSVAPKLRRRYPQDGALVMEARREFQDRYLGRLLAPSGQWIEAIFLPGQDGQMVSVHPGDQKVRWRRSVEILQPDTGPAPGGSPPPGAPPDRPAGGR